MPSAQPNITTPNASSWYVYIVLNSQDGPVVLDIPAATGAGLFGSLNEASGVRVTLQLYPQARMGPQIGRDCVNYRVRLLRPHRAMFALAVGGAGDGCHWLT